MATETSSRTPPLVLIKSTIKEFLDLESSSGIILMIVAGLALVIANSPGFVFYERLLDTTLQIRIGSLNIEKPLILWINDGLMAIFFLLIGLEVKREIVEGQLSERSQVVLPGLAAIGGMIVPAAIFVIINWGNQAALSGWAIPAATDIAFALGILALLGSRVPTSLKLFLMTIAIFDDLGAIAIIAIFYSADLSTAALVIAVLMVLLLVALNLMGVTRTAAYMLVGLVLWVAVLKSGVHATLAGVAIAFAIPIKARNEAGQSPLHNLEHSLHPWVAFGILPIFAFANAGVRIIGLQFGDLLSTIPLGIVAGLFVGKQIGVFGTTWLAIKLGAAKKPNGSNWLHLYGVSILCGIGFTMSFFIISLAFEHAGADATIFPGIRAGRIGILAGSLLAAIWGYLIVRRATRSAG